MDWAEAAGLKLVSRFSEVYAKRWPLDHRTLRSYWMPLLLNSSAMR